MNLSFSPMNLGPYGKLTFKNNRSNFEIVPKRVTPSPFDFWTPYSDFGPFYNGNNSISDSSHYFIPLFFGSITTKSNLGYQPIGYNPTPYQAKGSLQK